MTTLAHQPSAAVLHSSYANRACRFEISVDPMRALVRATLAGFFTVEDVRQFAQAEQAAAESLGCPPGEHRALIDATRSEVHSREVAEAFAHMVSASPLRARRLAVVAINTLHRIQTRRIISTDRSAMFATIEEAEAWIDADVVAVEKAAA